MPSRRRHSRSTPQRVADAIDERTAVVALSAVLFKSAAIVDLAPVIAKARTVGAPVLVDAYQWIGAIPLDVTALGADFVTGGSVKYLCGGPGAGFLYVRPDRARGRAAAADRLDRASRAVRLRPGSDALPRRRPAPAERHAARARASTPRRRATRSCARSASTAIRAKSMRLTARIVEFAQRARLDA